MFIHRNNTYAITIIASLLLHQQGCDGWLYTLPEGGCTSLSTCHSCVVEYARDVDGARRPCTWCPSTETCEMMMMNQSKACSSDIDDDDDDTFREKKCSAPIGSDLPPCIFFTYSYWLCFNIHPTSADQCDTSFVDVFCTPQTVNRQIELCNGDSFVLEAVVDPVDFEVQDALVVTKSEYSLDINLKYFWLNNLDGNGEDRRRLETNSSFSSQEMWLCNANTMHLDDETAVLKYQVQEEEDIDWVVDDWTSSSRALLVSSRSDGTTLRSVSVFCSILLAVILTGMLVWTEKILFSLFCYFIDCKAAQESFVVPYQQQPST